MSPIIFPCAAVLALLPAPATVAIPHKLAYPASAITLVAAAAEPAAVVTVGELEISGYWAKAMLPAQPVGAGYLRIANKGAAADRLVAVSSPAAGKAEIHKMEIADGVMTMRPVEGGLEIPVGATVELKPGGLHLMFMQVTEPFKDGATVAVALEFEKAGKVELALPVKKATGDDH